MSGHSKWSTIKRKKGALDAKRGKIFTRILKEIAISIKEGSSSDPDSNPRLRLAILNAKGVNMPKDNIQRAIAKANDKSSGSLTEITYEGYGPYGIPIYVECTTDNINRTVANVRALFTKFEGSLGTSGSLSFLFSRMGIFLVPSNGINEEEFTLEIIDAGADDVALEDDHFIIYTSFENFGPVQKKLDALKIEPESAEFQRIPHEYVKLEPDKTAKVIKLIDALEEDEDVNAVFHNLDLSEE